MKIFMIGEAANHEAKLAALLPPSCSFVALPREAAHSEEFDGALSPDDVLITLRLSRKGGRMPDFRLLHVPGAGLDGIDLDCLPSSTTVCNVFEHEIPIAEFAMLAMLNNEIRLGDMRQRFSDQRWSDAYRHRVPHGEIHGKTVGLIGMGRIARAIAARAKAFGMQVAATDIAGEAIPGLVDQFVAANDLGRLLTQADYLVVACPLTPSTRDMIGAAQLALMKPSSVIINVSRAEVIDQAALFHSLSARRIGGAVLDVWYRYPSGEQDEVSPADFPFHELANVICTPHSCAWTNGLPERRYAFIARNLLRLLAGEPLKNVVKTPSAHPSGMTPT